MGSEGAARRPFCLRCSKPSRTCLCGRLKFPPLDNSIAVTILQHSLEKTHPLNSSRVARLALKNLSLFLVTDVNFQAQFLIRPLESNRDSASSQCHEPSISEEIVDFASGNSAVYTYSEASAATRSSGVSLFQPKRMQKLEENFNNFSQTHLMDGEITSSFSKYTVSYSSKQIIVSIERTAKPDISWILNSPVGRTLISNGFVVRKLQRKELFQNSEEFKDFEEFNIVIPPGSVLLFPSSNAIELTEVDYEVKHLIVLDGTWAKARRMYYENPWLKLLPHLKLNQRKESLYSDVRHQPKVGYLSTIESIVCALEALGNDMKGLDEILDVFASMIRDQRRCRDEKFNAMLKS